MLAVAAAATSSDEEIMHDVIGSPCPAKDFGTIYDFKVIIFS